MTPYDLTVQLIIGNMVLGAWFAICLFGHTVRRK